MASVKVRARSVIKLITPAGSLIDLHFDKGVEVRVIANEVLHALVQAEGTAGAKKIVEDKLSTYFAAYEGL